jgi:hypothetical protein
MFTPCDKEDIKRGGGRLPILVERIKKSINLGFSSMGIKIGIIIKQPPIIGVFRWSEVVANTGGFASHCLRIDQVAPCYNKSLMPGT